MKIDNIDKKILDILQQDGRMSASNIANDLCTNIIYSPVSKKLIIPLKLLFSIRGNIYPSYIGHVLYSNPEWVPETNAP